MQPHRIHPIDRIPIDIAVAVLPSVQPNRIGLDVSAGGRIEVAVAVVIEVGEHLALPREAGGEVVVWRGGGIAAGVGGGDRHAEVAAVDPV